MCEVIVVFKKMSLVWKALCILGIGCDCYFLSQSQGLRHLFTPYFGEAQVLPAKVNSAVDLLRAHQIRTFSASPDINDGLEDFQRLSEGAYPSRMMSKAPYLLSLKKGKPGCTVIDVRESVYLLQCLKSL
jgi:hypothetical protein